MRTLGSTFAALVLAIPLTAQQPVSPTPADTTAIVPAVAIPAAERAARDWLVLVDRAQYRASYDSAAKSFQQAISADAWEDAVARGRGPFGTFGRRATYQTPRLLHDPKGLPPGDYVVFLYLTPVTTGGTAVIETVSTEREADGAWRVDGYFVAPGA